jgi:hypothetical protein
MPRPVRRSAEFVYNHVVDGPVPMAYQTNPDRTISAILATSIFFNLLILGHYLENKSPPGTAHITENKGT